MNLMHPERRRREAAKRASPRLPKKTKLKRRQVALELYEDDCKVLENRYGSQWYAVVRDWINQFVRGADRLTVLEEIQKEYRNDD